MEQQEGYTEGYRDGYRAGWLAMRKHAEVAAKAVGAPTVLVEFLESVTPVDSPLWG